MCWLGETLTGGRQKGAEAWPEGASSDGGALHRCYHHLRARWALKGKPVEVPIMGNRNKRVLYGALNPRSGAICLDQALRWNQDSFQKHLRHLKAQWRGWNIVLFFCWGLAP